MSTNEVSVGAAYDYARKVLGGVFDELETNPSVGTTSSIIVPENPDRVGVVVVNLGGGQIFVSFSSAVSTSNGIVLNSNGGSLVLLLPFDLTLCSRRMTAISDGAGPYNAYVLELVRVAKVGQ